jgi:ribonuclease HI
MTKPVIELYTDGSCPVQREAGGWAYVLRIPESGTEYRRSGGVENTTNNRMELQSIIEGLKSLPRSCKVTLYTDSQYCSLGMGQWMAGWKKKDWMRKGDDGLEPIKNQDLWVELDALMQVHEVKAVWVRGHDGNVLNEVCDKMCGEAAKKIAASKRKA